MARPADEARKKAIALAADTMAELVDFWGFKSSMGRIWTVLYLSPDPLTADAIAEETRLSAGAVSMALAELMQWGLVSRDLHASDRKRHYRAETDVWAIVRRIIREREMRLVGRAVERFGLAVAVLEEAQRADPSDRDVSFMLERLRGLLELARMGHTLVETLAEVGQFSLLPIRGMLARVTERA